MIPTPALNRINALMLPVIALIATASAQIDVKNWGKNSPGVALAFREGPRQRSPQGTILMYNLVGKGFPVDVPYVLWRWIPDKEPQPVMERVSFDKRGVLVCSGRPGFCQGDGPDDPINIKTTAVLGEPKRMALVSADGTVAAFAEAVPFPIEASDKNCKLSVVRMDTLAETVVARATGFVADESLTVTTQSNDEGATTRNAAGPQENGPVSLLAPRKARPRARLPSSSPASTARSRFRLIGERGATIRCSAI